MAWPAGRIALSVGRFTEQKNPVALINAFAAAVRADGNEDWTLVFVGEGPMEEAMREAASREGVSEHIVIRPPERDLLPIYNASSVVVLPSLFEGMSNVCLEAAACGRPVAVTRGAGADALIDAGGGWLLEDAPKTLAQGLASVFRSTSSERDDAGRLGQAFVEANNSVARTINTTMALYDRIGDSSAFPWHAG